MKSAGLDTLRVFIIGDEFGFPFGRATVNRVRDIATGLMTHGVAVALLLTEPSEPAHIVRNERWKGHAHRIPFIYTSGRTITPGGFIRRRILRFLGLLRCVALIAGHRKRMKTAVILYVRHMITVVVLGSACKIMHINCLLELCEWPSALPSSTRYHALRRRVFQQYAALFVDGAIVISRFLEDRLRLTWGGRRTSFKTLIVPILVESTMFDDVSEARSETREENPRFVYCGFLDHIEPIFFLLAVAAELRKRGQRFTLQIVGTAADPRFAEDIRKKAESYCVTGSVTLTGYLSRTDLLRVYRSATALLLPLERGDRSEARFPTKLGEYLLSGRPVVVSQVGESGFYLNHGTSCIFVPPDDEQAFADALQLVSGSADVRMRLGAAGADVAKREFNPVVHGGRIADFIRSL